MQLTIVSLEVELTEQQTKQLDETLRMQLGRYTQIIELVLVNFKYNADQFGQLAIQCNVKIDLRPTGSVSAANTSMTIEEAFFNAISRAKRQLERQRKNSKKLYL